MLSHLKLENLDYILSPWPFSMWGMDIIRLSNLGKGQCRFLLVGVDYFIKWIEDEPLVAIIAKIIQNFVWKNIICRFDIPDVIITDND